MADARNMDENLVKEIYQSEQQNVGNERKFYFKTNGYTNRNSALNEETQ